MSLSSEEAMMKMFTEVQGEITGSCYTTIDTDDEGDATGINVMKDGNLCWHKSKVDILFDYIALDFEEEQ